MSSPNNQSACTGLVQQKLNFEAKSETETNIQEETTPNTSSIIGEKNVTDNENSEENKEESTEEESTTSSTEGNKENPIVIGNSSELVSNLKQDVTDEDSVQQRKMTFYEELDRESEETDDEEVDGMEQLQMKWNKINGHINHKTVEMKDDETKAENIPLMI